MILYGLSNCDNCRKAQAALKAAGHLVHLRDVRAEPLTPEEKALFVMCFGDRIVNRASTTWRVLTDAERRKTPEELLTAHPALMKRPLIDRDGSLFLGFGPEVRAALLT